MCADRRRGTARYIGAAPTGRRGTRLNADAHARLASLILDLNLLPTRSAVTEKLGQSLGEFETAIRNSVDMIPIFGERYRQGDTIATAFVESTITQVVSK